MTGEQRFRHSSWDIPLRDAILALQAATLDPSTVGFTVLIAHERNGAVGLRCEECFRADVDIARLRRLLSRYLRESAAAARRKGKG